jgi:tRNA(Ile)-lysidine synthase TilS/MesJ
MKSICSQCVLDSNFPGISFNNQGVCNFCQKQSLINMDKEPNLKWINRFNLLVKENRGKGIYDCLIAYSGGKDSTYTLGLMKNEYDLKILAFSFDNWFQSEKAVENIKKVVAELNVDHITIRPSYKNFQKIINLTGEKELYSKKAMERATAICTTCLALIRFSGLKIAIEKNIPFFILGMSPGQAPLAASIYKMNAAMIRKMQQAIYQPLYAGLGSVIDPYFLEEQHLTEGTNYPYLVNPLAFHRYNENEIYDYNNKLGWEAPGNTDSNSTNCLLNAFANQIHQNKYGYHPYSYEIAGLVRAGSLPREEGLKRLDAVMDESIIEWVKRKLMD